ncbi:CBS domain-containing protein [archaeon]|jgi:predicted transcriptional regulator|nr:CBS domain-containing protein [archaeon]
MKKWNPFSVKVGVKVGDVMARNFISINFDAQVLEAVKLMVKKRVGSLIVVEKGLLRGILTEKDIIWALSKKKDLSGIKVGDICIRKITTIKPSADIYDAVKLMKRVKFRRLPVTVNKKVIGYLTLKDILKIQPELFQIAKEGYALKGETVRENFEEGICEECERFDLLYSVDGKKLCERCKEMGE